MEKKQIVLAEDEETIANLMIKKLEHAGYAVRRAKNGAEALEMIRSKKPDLVLLDIVMPDVNGFAVLEELQKEHLTPELPVVVISNSGEPLEIGRILKLGARDYLIKVNFSPQEVLDKVNRVLADIPSAELNAAPSSNSPKILIVEDDMILVSLLKRKFVQHHYQVYAASNTHEAERILKEESIAVILLDIVLPDVDGFSFLKKIKMEEPWKKIPVVIISNLGQKEEAERGIQMGAVDYIIKANVLPNEIFDKVEAILHSARSPAA